jgi:hypothetical protein
MRADLTERLFSEFPDLYAARRVADTRLASDGIAVGDGWFELLRDLSAQLDSLSSRPLALQVKQKFGGLRLYLVPGTRSDAARALIRTADERSFRTCERCGATGTLRRFETGLMTTCADHAEGSEPCEDTDALLS